MKRFISTCLISILCLILASNTYGQNTTSIISSENVGNLEIIQILGNGSQQLNFSPDGRILATLHTNEITQEDHILFWDVDTLVQLADIYIPNTSIDRFIFHTDNTHLIIAGTIGKVLIWNIEQGQLISEWQAHSSSITMLAINSSGDVLVTGSQATSNAEPITIWWDLEDVTRPDEISRYGSQFSGTVSTGLFFNDDSLFASGAGLQLQIWGNGVDEPSHILSGHNFLINDMVYMPSRTLLATVSEIRIILWNADQIQARSTYRYDVVVVRSDIEGPYALTSIDATADGQLIITGDSHGMLKIWQTDTLELLRTIPAYDSAIGMVRVSPNNDTIFVVAQETNEVQVWRIAE